MAWKVFHVMEIFQFCLSIQWFRGSFHRRHRMAYDRLMRRAGDLILQNDELSHGVNKDVLYYVWVS